MSLIRTQVSNGVGASLLLYMFGILMRVMHWPMGKESMVVGLSLFALLYTVYFLSSFKTNKALEWIRWCVVVGVFTIQLVQLNEIGFMKSIGFVVPILFLIYCIIELLYYVFVKEYRAGFDLFFALGLSGLFTQTLFSFLHLPGAGVVFILYVISLVLVAIGFFRLGHKNLRDA